MKHKKQVVLCLILLLVLGTYFLRTSKVNRVIAKDLGVKVPYTLDFQYSDSHGGFFGDGIALGKAELKDRDIAKLLKKGQNYWVKTPIPKELDILLYGDGNYHSYLARNLAIKPIENGYWLYIDRVGGKRRYLGEIGINRYSNHYSIGLLDLDEKIFYYIKFDS